MVRRYSIGTAIVYGLTFGVISATTHVVFVLEGWKSGKTWPEIVTTSLLFGLAMGFAMPMYRRYAQRRMKTRSDGGTRTR